LIAGGYIGFFPESLVKQFRRSLPAIVQEGERRVVEKEARAQSPLSEAEMEMLQSLLPSPELDRHIAASVGLSPDAMDILRKVAWADYASGEGIYGTRDVLWDPALDRLAASVGLNLDAMDTTGDKYVLKYLSKDLAARSTKLTRFRLPRLDLLTPQDLAALLSSDEVLDEVGAVLDGILRKIPRGLSSDPEGATQWIDERLSGEFQEALGRLKGRLRSIPDAAKVGGNSAAVGATVYSGVLTASPTLALAFGAGGAAAGAVTEIAAAWLRQRRRRSSSADGWPATPPAWATPWHSSSATPPTA
jgi:hypothetical protein